MMADVINFEFDDDYLTDKTILWLVREYCMISYQSPMPLRNVCD